MLTFNQIKTLSGSLTQTTGTQPHSTNTKEIILTVRKRQFELRVRCTRAGQWGKPTFHVVSSRFDETNKEKSLMKGRNPEHRDSTVYYSEPQFLYAVGWQANGRH